MSAWCARSDSRRRRLGAFVRSDGDVSGDHVNDFATRVVLGEIAAERSRQEVKCAEKRDEGENWRTCADPLSTDDVRLAVLTEEFLEAVKEINDARAEQRDPSANLRVELVQLAAVAVAWVEHLDQAARKAAA